MKGEDAVWGSTSTGGKDSWATPARYLKPVIAVFAAAGHRGIELDPCASADEMDHFASVNYTEALDGLKQVWRAQTCFVNAPYSQALRFHRKLVEHYLNGDIDTAIVLMAARTETLKFRVLAEEASAICFVNHRIKFLDPDAGMEPRGSAGFPSAYVYLGTQPSAFCDEFRELGTVWLPG